jgi:hypothetical protein
MKFETGTYAGDGTSSKVISLNEISGTPDFVLTQINTGRFPAYRMTGMTQSQRLGSALEHSSDGITALSAGSFTVGSNADVNTDTLESEDYNYFAIEDVGGEYFVVDSYTGNASATQDVVTGLSDLECVFVFPDTSANDCFHCLSMGGTTDASFILSDSQTAQTGYITDISTTAGQFTAGSNLNTDGTTYWYMAFKPAPGYIDSISYTGDTTDNRDLNVDPNSGGKTPEFAMTANAGTGRAKWWRAEEGGRGHSGDDANQFNPNGNSSDRIQAFSSETVQLGANLDVNVFEWTYHLFWLVSNPTAPVPTVIESHPQRIIRKKGWYV